LSILRAHALRRTINRLVRPPVALIGLAVSTAFAAELSPTGLWKTIDDHSGRLRGAVQIYEKGGAFFGKVEAAFDPREAAERCRRCRDDRKDKPIIGLMIIRGLKKNGDEYTGGDILDPENGMVYRCKLRLIESGSKLVVRGYFFVPLLGRSQIWIRQP
jgi:uncharacterized protein (DUF2147 family)